MLLAFKATIWDRYVCMCVTSILAPVYPQGLFFIFLFGLLLHLPPVVLARVFIAIRVQLSLSLDTKQ